MVAEMIRVTVGLLTNVPPLFSQKFSSSAPHPFNIEILGDPFSVLMEHKYDLASIGTDDDGGQDKFIPNINDDGSA